MKCPQCQNQTGTRMNRAAGLGRLYCAACGWIDTQPPRPSGPMIVNKTTEIVGKNREGVKIVSR